jgi:hypothetical protein
VISRNRLTLTGNSIRCGGTSGKRVTLPASQSGIDPKIKRGINSTLAFEMAASSD